ncbi:fimbrial protein [Escherichia coli]|uniref:F4 family fimbrial subunit n=1 Tax=Escherichia coli TaxID=562 RepID=UPI00157B86AC|nr:fimbrial protein [Escherichia coli]
MKKTLIALTVAASAVSGMAHAWTNGDFNGSVDIGGNITADEYKQKWSWKVGGDINGFTNKLTDLTNDGTKLVITVDGDKPILLGKTNEAFNALSTGVGAVPQIAFTDYEGTPVVLTNPDSGANNGLAYLVLPVKNADGSKIGSVKVNTSYAGVAAYAYENNETVPSKFSTKSSNVNSIFYGGIPSGELKIANDAFNLIAKFGGLTENEVLQQVQDKIPGVEGFLTTNTSKETSMVNSLGNGVTAAAYALGISNGQTIEATFDSAVTASTQWSAPLNVAVTYN